MTRRLKSTSSPSTTSVSNPSPKPKSPYRWDDSQHPMYSHPNFKAHGQAGFTNGLRRTSPPSPTPYSTSYTPNTIPGTPAPLAVPPLENCPLPEAHTMVSVGGILRKIPSRMTKKTEAEAEAEVTSTSPASTTSFVPDASPKAELPYRWDHTQHPMYSHASFKTYRQTAMINGINPSTVHYIPTTIPGTPAPIEFQTPKANTTISIGGILTKIPPRMVKTGEAEAQAPTPNAPNKKEAYPMPTMPITQSLINRGIVAGEKTGSAPRSCKQILTMTGGFAAAAAVSFVSASNSSDGERSELKWEREQGRQKKRKENECWSDEEDWVGLQSGLHIEGKNVILPVRAKEEEGAMAKQWYKNNENSLGFQPGCHQQPVSSIDDKSTPKSNQWALGQDIDADESCTAVSPNLVLSSLCEDSEPVPMEGTMERYGRILHSMPGDEKRKARALMESIEDLMPSSIGEDSCYLVAIGALVGTRQSELVADLYLYLCEKKQRQALVKRMREGLLKLIPIVGMPLITRAFKALVAVEAPCDHDTSTSWTSKRLTPERLEKARVSMATFLAPEELQTMYEGFGYHRDLAWVTENIVYGLFLSDTTILDEKETELVVLPAMLCTGREPLAEVHMAGALRQGFAVEEVESMHAICELLAGWKSVDERGLREGLRGLKRAGDVRW